MKKLLFLILFSFSFSLLSNAQARIIDKDGTSYKIDRDDFCSIVFNFRAIYDRYPYDKAELLAFHKRASRFDYGDKVMNAYYSRINAQITKTIKSEKNKYSVSGDSCSFFLSELHRTIQWDGGMKELLRTDNHLARVLYAHPCCLDKKGRVIWSFFHDKDSLSLTKPIRDRFRYIATMEEIKSENTLYPVEDKTAVIIPFTMTRSGDFYYDKTYLDGIQLFYQENGKPFEGKTLGKISRDDAIDTDYIKAVQSYLKRVLKKYPEIDSIKMWEYVLFNNTPKQ